MRLTDCPSPNQNERRHPLDILVLHYTGMETADAARERLCDPAAQVSAHYLLLEGGDVLRLVPEDRRAWHAGVSSWQGEEDLNSRSIGIEIVNGGHDWPLADGTPPPYPGVQIEALIELCQGILSRHAIAQTRIVGHSDIAPARKIDPGEHFPWTALAEQGIGLWPAVLDGPSGLLGTTLAPGSEGADVERLQSSLKAIGYGMSPTGIYDEATEAVVRAFQRRFLPDRLTGLADAVTIARIYQIDDAYSRWRSEFAAPSSSA